FLLIAGVSLMYMDLGDCLWMYGQFNAKLFVKTMVKKKVNRKRKTKEHHCHYPQQQMTNL
nr:hypothetical protein [Tanacetum cinerariifolium]